jgi:hypothetical protein
MLAAQPSTLIELKSDYRNHCRSAEPMSLRVKSGPQAANVCWPFFPPQ